MSIIEATTLTVTGDLTEETAPALLQSIREACDERSPNLVLNVEDAEAVDSYGLGALIRALKITRDAGGSLVVGKASPELVRMMSLTGIDQVVPVKP